jgi:hypothetical protein
MNLKLNDSRAIPKKKKRNPWKRNSTAKTYASGFIEEKIAK